MWPIKMEAVFKECERRRVQQALVSIEKYKMKMIRFSDSSVTVSKHWNTANILVYLIKDEKKVACLLEDIGEDVVRRSIGTILDSLKYVKSREIKPDLPKGPFDYGVVKNCYDEKIKSIDEMLVDVVRSVVDSASHQGAENISGTFTAIESQRHLKSTEGCEGEDEQTYFELTVRAFSDKEASGYANWCGSTLDGFDPQKMGCTAAKLALMSKSARRGRPGNYDIVLSPSVMGNLLNEVGNAASAYLVDMGISFLGDMLNKEVASESLSLMDNPRFDGSPGARLFDDEGSPTKPNPIIEKGILKGYLHSSHTAKKSGTNPTGNAYFDSSLGDMVPSPVSLVVQQGDYSEEELIQEVKEGLYITNTWYTRFQNYEEGSFSTIPRDSIIHIEKGELTYPIKGIRISGNILELLRSIQGISRKRYWIRWWELDTPINLPYFLVEGAKVSASTK